MNDLREAVAALEHEQWAHWTRWQIDHATPEMIARWERQIVTPYADLSEREKDADREWADRVLGLLAAHDAAPPPSTRVPVDSSNVAEIGYDAASRTLEVQFRSGGVYRYASVPRETHAALMAAESKGSFLATHITPHHECTKLPPPEEAE